jgi:hypothetical protein
MRERRARREKASHAPWYLLTGFLLGLAAGAVFSLWLWPVPYDFALPSEMNSVSKDAYRLLIARTYYADGDSGRARPRLSLLKDIKVEDILGTQAQVALGQNNDIDSGALARLALIVNPINQTATGSVGTTPEGPSSSPSPETTGTPAGEVESTPTPDETLVSASPYPTISSLKIPSAEIPHSTPTMFPTLSAPYILKERAADCGRSLRPSLLQIWVENATGLAMPGVRIQINWKDGEETFHTGLKPDINAGYADFEMAAGTVYSLRVGENGETITGLGTADCTSEGHPERTGGMVLRFTER